MRTKCARSVMPYILPLDDGSKGHKGFVTDPLKKMLEDRQDIALVVAIGPVIMMKNVAETSKAFDVPTVVSLNPIMVDGTGMCGGCRVSVDNENKFVCVVWNLMDTKLTLRR